MEYKNGQYDFVKDINTGEQGELFIRKFMEAKNFKYINNCKTFHYDLKMGYNGNEYTYEIKTDVYKKDTGNLVIEFECRNKPSGINLTQADYFVYFYPFLGEIWTIRCSELRKLIANTKPLIFEGAGDKGSNTKLYRLKKKDIGSYFKLHFISSI